MTRARAAACAATAAARARKRASGRGRCVRTVLAIALSQALGGGARAEPALEEQGRQIYLEGRVGAARVSASRAGGLQASGQAVACVNCHRRSAQGGAEGRSYVPPINAAALFNPIAAGSGGAPAGLGRPAYTEASLAQALNHGVDPAGRTLDALMPRYAFDAAQVHALTAYLNAQERTPVRGVENSVLHLASVVAGDVSPARRRLLQQTLDACVAEHNAGVLPPPRRKRLAAPMAFAAPRRWTVQVWELSGPASGWAEQLALRLREQPVFALIGGVLGNGAANDWAPVHALCEAERLPCLYPHLEMPPSEVPGNYAVYTHAGVQLEAELIAHAVRASGERRVVQWARRGDRSASAGAAALRAALAPGGVVVEELWVESFDRSRLSTPASHVLWLRGPDLDRVPDTAWRGQRLFASATLLEHQPERVPAALRPSTTLAHPHALGAQREARRRELSAWLRKHQLALEDEPLQADLLLACNALHLGLDEVTQRPDADALIERIEALSERRGFAGLYPGLSLGTGQRVASKTGYLVRFAGPAAAEPLEPLGEAFAP